MSVPSYHERQRLEAIAVEVQSDLWAALEEAWEEIEELEDKLAECQATVQDLRDKA